VPDTVKRLLDHFDQDRRVFQSGDYKEEQLRAEFLNPFFTALGWDMDMPAYVLGHVCEQFLGEVIRPTAGHQAKVEEKPECRVAACALGRPSTPSSTPRWNPNPARP